MGSAAGPAHPMDGNVQQRSSRASSLDNWPTLPSNDDPDCDAISLTSTVVEDDGEEYVVEDVHAEREVDGETKYLIEWANYPLDWCTWEPHENLNLVLFAQWEDKKATDDPSVSRDFVARYEAAHNKLLEESRQRHHWRNAERRRLGLPTTRFYFRNTRFPDPDDPDDTDDTDDEMDAALDLADNQDDVRGGSSDEFTEASEDNNIDHRTPGALKPSKLSTSSFKAKENKAARPTPENRIFKYQPEKARSVSSTRSDSKSPTVGGSKTFQRPKPKQTTRDRELPSATGYQGSARKVSTTSSTQPADVNARTGHVDKSTVSGATAAACKAKSNTTRPDKKTGLQATAAAVAAPFASKSSSASAPTSSKGLASARPSDKIQKMKRTAKSTSTAVNIFDKNRSKTRKARDSMAEREIDPKLPPQMYKKSNHLQKALKRSRDRDERVPSIENIPTSMYAPNFRPTQQEQGSKDARSSAHGPAEVANSAQERRSTVSTPVPNVGPTQQKKASKDARSSADGLAEVAKPPPQERRSTFPAPEVTKSSSMREAPFPVRAPKRSSLSCSADRPRKMAKSVRFTETELGPSTSQELFTSQRISTMVGERFPQKEDSGKIVDDDDDDFVFVAEPMDIDDPADLPNDAPSGVPSTGVKKLNLSTYMSRSHALGAVDKKIKLSNSDTLLDVTFNSFPPNSMQDTDQWLRDFLGTECLDIGHTFLALSLVSQLGTLASQSWRFLPLCSGALSSRHSSESLDILAERLRSMSSGLFLAQKTFNLVIFPTKCDDFDKLNDFGVGPLSPGFNNVVFKYFIFTSDMPIFQLMRPSSSHLKGLASTVGKEKLLLFPIILAMQYSPLTAPYSKHTINFFLAFPERAECWLKSIASWLTERNPKCKIYTNFDPGSWLAFSKVFKEERGVVIIHDALVPFIRRMPHFNKLLRTSVIVWQFSEGLGPEQPRPLVNSPIVPVISTLFSRIFPVGHVILLTPSFLVSEPKESYKLVNWFFKMRAKTQTNKLVVAYNIVDFLRDLSVEKTEYRERLRQGTWRFQSELDIAVDKSQGALTDDDLAARQKLWFYLQHWLSQQTDNEVPYSEFNSVIFADRSIDPHDEQSLVNWFGMWSMMHCQDYRRFYVVGSSGEQPSGSVIPPTPRVTKTMRIPRFHRSVVNDPDEALRNALLKAGQISPSFTFRSEYFGNDESQIKPRLGSMVREGRDRFVGILRFEPPWAVYTNPVSWSDRGMADHLGDSAMRFATIEQWWESIRPWNAYRNTYIAFFYTNSNEGRPENLPKGTAPEKHTWLAIWRPCEVHNKQDDYAHGRTELVIWDARVGEQLEATTSPGLQDLTWMQRALVEFIRLHAHEKNTGSYLKRIWVGGSEAQRAAFGIGSKLPADQTADMLNLLFTDLKDAVPSPPHAMWRRQYRDVPIDADQQKQDPGRMKQTAPLYGDEEDPDLRIIIHPPRGGQNLQPQNPSRCRNGLFEASRIARLHTFGPQDNMVYTFPPTMAWYQNQVAEGRQFDHILVAPWEKIFSEEKIFRDIAGDTRASSRNASNATSATSAHPPQAGRSRDNSVSSNHSSSTY